MRLLSRFWAVLMLAFLPMAMTTWHLSWNPFVWVREIASCQDSALRWFSICFGIYLILGTLAKLLIIITGKIRALLGFVNAMLVGTMIVITTFVEPSGSHPFVSWLQSTSMVVVLIAWPIGDVIACLTQRES